ncbi:MAG TPA: NAD(P)-dependent oxidoreductase [Blastocatellia bacterium]|nr:NAD(P)-dependent oxidoreductase [Blastocatellia bacterium]
MKITLITGASGGIGEAFARRLAVEGHNLFLAARSEEKLSRLCDELRAAHGITAHFLAIDLSVPGAHERLFDETERLSLEVELLINNAGFGSKDDFLRLDIERELEMIRLNVMSLTALSHVYLKKMRERRSGAIINVSSAAGFQPVPYMATYAATKAYVSSFSEAIAEENREYGIKVLALCPGSTKTDFFRAANIDRAIHPKGQQTAEEVVDTALAALGKGRRKIVSGWTNFLLAAATNFVPNFLIARVVARAFRPQKNGG